MLTPEQIVEIVELMQPSIDELNTWITKDLIERIIARMARNKDWRLSATDKWQIQVMQETGAHIDKLQEEITKWTRRSDAEVARIFEDAGIKALSYDSRFYISHGLEGINLAQSEGMIRLLQDTYQRTLATIHNFTRTTAEASQKRLIDELDKAYSKTASGATSYAVAVQEAVESVAAEQVKVQYPTGHVDTIETAILRAVRTGVGQASGNMAIEGMLERDWDIILVSAHLGARYGDGGENPSNHFWWQGKFYTRTGRTPNLPDFIKCTGYGTGEGLCGWNCRHSFGPGDLRFNPYAKYDAAENKKAYDLSQRQRRMEREIRKTKGEMIGLKQGIDACTDPDLKAELQEKYNKKAGSLESQNLAYNDFSKENSFRRYDDRLSVARWDREQARASIVAARAAASKEPDQISLDSYMKQTRTPAVEEPFEDVTEEWYATATPNSHEVLDLQEWTVDGKVYPVDGHNVRFVYDDHEKRIAELLEREFGGEIYMVPKVEYPKSISTPDYLFRGDQFDLKTIKGKGKSVLYGAISKKKRQSSNFIFDLTDCPLLNNEILNQIRSIYKSDHTKFVDILMLVKNDKMLRVLARAKK